MEPQGTTGRQPRPSRNVMVLQLVAPCQMWVGEAVRVGIHMVRYASKLRLGRACCNDGIVSGSSLA